MRKKYKVLLMILFFVTVLAGCNQKKDKKLPIEIKESTKEENINFPDRYELETEKVKFQCVLEVPEKFIGQANQYFIKGQTYCDADKLYKLFAAGIEVKEHHSNPTSDGYPEDNTYILADGGMVGSGTECIYNSKNSAFYNRMDIMDDRDISSDKKLSFAEPEICIEEVKKILHELGYSGDDFFFTWHSLNAQVLKGAEDQLVAEGSIQQEQRKSQWSTEDDAYVIYAYQKCGDLPVYHEILSLGQQLAYDTPSGAPVQVVYTSRGLESLMVNNIYEIEEIGETVALKEFDEIAKVVEEKFNNILNDSEYVVNRAKIYERVSFNENQKYVAEPIWYFEVAESGARSSVTLVSAVTGKEIYLP